MSKLLLRTLREAPADAETPSNVLLVRGGYIRRIAAGIYSWLPLGKKVLDNVAQIVREEMDAIGAQEVLFPALIPSEHFEASGRWKEYGDLIFRLQDRRGADYLLGPTHEELFTLMVKGESSSYRDFPLTLYQIQTKYRDEPRPRAAIVRGREFVMKDSYSFDLDDAGLQRSYDLHRQAYINAFERLGLSYRIVSAISGAMGGSHSEEFLAPTPFGEDTFVVCENCDYAANVEAVEAVVPPVEQVDHPPVEVMDTPDTPTIETLAAHLGVSASETLKNLLVKVDGEVVAIGVPGDRDVDMKRLEDAMEPANIEPFTDEDFATRPDLVKGYVGPQDGKAGTGFRYFADPRIAVGTSWITGANVKDKHARNVVAGRDFFVERYIEVATVLAGDPCPRCGGALSIDRGMEIGHIFQLGRKYADAFALDVDGPDGQPIRITMGSYGIGISRAVAAIAEQCHDDAGLSWPASVAPYDVHVIPVGRGEQPATAERLAEELSAAGLQVLLDDRDASPGEKFADADLVGVPTQVIVGKALADGEVEVKDRRSGDRRRVALHAAAAQLATR